MAKVVVVGGGVSGLFAALELSSRHEVVVLEAGPTAGGLVRSTLEEGRVIEQGPNGWLDNEPAMREIIARLGLESDLVRASETSSIRWIYAGGRPQPLPMGPPALIRSGLLSPWAKLRLLFEPFVGRRRQDETVARFFARRLGEQVVRRLVGPMCSGVFASPPEQLSLEAAFPSLARMEEEHGSLVLAMMRGGAKGSGKAPLTSLRQGVGELTEALVRDLGERVRTGSPVDALEHRKDGWRVHGPQGTEEADAVLLACPAPAQARIVRSVDAEAAQALDQIAYAPVAVVVTAYKDDAFPTPPQGFGVLVAQGEDVGVLGTLYTSCIFPSFAPPGEHLLRTLIGGAGFPDAAREDDAALLARTQAALGKFLGTPRVAPHAVRIFRHERAIPVYGPGHKDRERAVRKAETRRPGLFFAGNHLGGIGVKDCACTARERALAAHAWLSRDEAP